MKSIKPGRGPSFMGGIISIFVGLFGVFWTVLAASNGGGVFAVFGLIFIGIAVVQAVYNFKNATGKNRYSQYDITDGDEEPDPLNERFGAYSYKPKNDVDCKFCPYCGNPVSSDFEFCNNCGKKLP